MQELQQQSNEAARMIGELKSKGQNADEWMKKSKIIKEKMLHLKQQQENCEDTVSRVIDELLITLPNIPADDVPEGESEEDNVEIRRWSEPKTFHFSAKTHEALGEAMGLMDSDTAAKISGSRFTILKGDLAHLERALAQFMMDIHTREFLYTEVSVPLLVRDSAMFGAGQLPKFAEDAFSTNDGYWLIPTAEVPLTNMVGDAIIPLEQLPLRYVSCTPCFRSEAGSAGRDTRGMLRQHQFWKVEMVSITTPELSDKEHERMTGCAEEILQRLGLPYRVMLLCASDMGFAARKTYDLEVWLPGQARYREISSCSNCGDFQARRMKARYKATENQNTFVHTLNGSGLAVGRTLIAIMENYQNEDGSIHIPDVLQPYMGGKKVIG
jgi:seryl-tRNA synthetase